MHCKGAIHRVPSIRRTLNFRYIKVSKVFGHHYNDHLSCTSNRLTDAFKISHSKLDTSIDAEEVATAFRFYDSS